ncbi:Methyl-accepting chemotaxis protein [Sulfidibacter corallicola]|uniref:Methyl-accepting chemotaxis protein n=1 Tax=Sulfidibacter corallicola TaxID=2818388 RepID=A0A8A4TIZ5_SULCO|nr:methyl-accepting chemotaxis protein [Sulfidibacter corallicola]QTD49999.1 methyl-accepting chemotaxis protein [Sulfidibacter corallicola]
MGKGSLTWYIQGPVILMLLCFLGVGISAFQILEHQKNDGLVINVAGRQRMLSQKFTKEVFIELTHPGQFTGEGQPRTAQLAVTRTLFERSLEALTKGGATYADLAATKEVTLPATTDDGLLVQLESVRAKWRTMIADSEILISQAREGLPLDSALEAELRTVNLEVLAEMNAIVGGYQSLSEGKVQALKSIVTYGFIVSLLCAFLAFWICRQRVVKPLARAIDLARAVSAGDLSQQVERFNRDEVGDLCRALNTMCADLSIMLREISRHGKDLSRNSSELTAVSDGLQTEAKGLLEKAKGLGLFSKEVTNTIEVASRRFGEAGDLSASVASSAEQMSVASSAIAQSSELVVKTSKGAVDQTTAAMTNVNELRNSARHMDQVVEVIVNISDQTKLLALNATIEAARAGQSGKGFAVVAEEVKILAQQTNRAIQQIRGKLESIQVETESSASEISQIAFVIGDVDKVIDNIVSFVHEQKAATAEVSQAISGVSSNIQEVQTLVNQMAGNQVRLNQDVAGVELSGRGLADAVESVNNQAMDLKDLSGELENIVNRFQLAG